MRLLNFNGMVHMVFNATIICFYCAEKGTKRTHRNVGDIVCTVKGSPLDCLGYANSLHTNLEFNLETPNASGDMAFLDLNINVNEDRRISCHRYQKLTDIGIILNLRSCAPSSEKTEKTV